jgi:hypothetical protein
VPGASFEAVTGRLGIGAIAFLGLYLFVDGLQIGVFELVEAYGKSATWSILGVIPTAVVTYIVGVFCLGIAEVALARFPSFRSPPPADIIALSRTGSVLLQQLYSEDLRNHELLKGASIAFVILALGATAEAQNMNGYVTIVWLSALGAFALSVLSLIFSRRAAARAAALARTVQAYQQVAA